MYWHGVRRLKGLGMPAGRVRFGKSGQRGQCRSLCAGRPGSHGGRARIDAPCVQGGSGINGEPVGLGGGGIRDRRAPQSAHALSPLALFQAQPLLPPPPASPPSAPARPSPPTSSGAQGTACCCLARLWPPSQVHQARRQAPAASSNAPSRPTRPVHRRRCCPLEGPPPLQPPRRPGPARRRRGGLLLLTPALHLPLRPPPLLLARPVITPLPAHG